MCDCAMAVEYKTDDLRILEIQDVVPPDQVHAEYPLTEKAAETTFKSRQAIHRILTGADD